MTASAIITAAFNRLSTLPDLPPVAWPGVHFEPPTSGEWLEINVFPNEPGSITMAVGDAQIEIGFIQVLANVRPGVGIVSVVALAETIAAHFPKALELGPVRVRAKPWLSPPQSEGDRLIVPCTIPYRGIAA